MLKFDWLTSRKILLLKQCWNLTGWRAEKYFYWNSVEIWLADEQKNTFIETMLKFDRLTGRKILLLKQCWNLTGWQAEKYFYWNNVEIWLADGQKNTFSAYFRNNVEIWLADGQKNTFTETMLKFDWLTSRKIHLLHTFICNSLQISWGQKLYQQYNLLHCTTPVAMPLFDPVVWVPHDLTIKLCIAQ